MIAGKLRYRLRIKKPVSGSDGFGEETPIYKNVGIVHAERVKISGARKDEVGEHFPDYRAEFNIRVAHQIDENWRVEQLGGHEYTVTNVIPNPER